MNLKKTFLSTLTILALTLSACAGRNDGPSGSLAAPMSADASVSKTATPIQAEDSDTLTDEGEAALAPQTLDVALAKFHAALTADASNARAKFWIGALKPLLLLKGIATRARPVFDDPVYGKGSSYSRFVSTLVSHHTPEVMAFLKDGPEDIKTPAEVEDWMAQLDNAVFEFRHTIKDIKNSDITINLPTAFGPMGSIMNISSPCGSMTFGPIHHVDGDCARNENRQIGLNRADFESILTSLSMYQIYLEVWSAYRINPLLLSKVGTPFIRTRADAEQFAAALVQDGTKEGGHLRSAQAFNGVKEMGDDLVVSMQYLIDNQDTLCPKGQFGPANRPGYLVYYGVCLSNSDSTGAQRTLDSLEAFVAGRPVELFYGENQKADVNLLKLTQHPLNSLDDLRPMQFDSCGNVIGMNETPFNEYVVSGSLAAAFYSPDRACTTPAVAP